MLLKTNPFNIENNNSLGRTIGFHFDSVCLYFVNKITTAFVIKTLCMHSMHTHTYTHPVRDRERERERHTVDTIVVHVKMYSHIHVSRVSCSLAFRIEVSERVVNDLPLLKLQCHSSLKIWAHECDYTQHRVCSVHLEDFPPSRGKSLFVKRYIKTENSVLFAFSPCSSLGA